MLLIIERTVTFLQGDKTLRFTGENTEDMTSLSSTDLITVNFILLKIHSV